jgi:serine/threonine-protein kinase RsbW
MSNNHEILTIESDKKELIKVEAFLRNIFEDKQLPEDSFNKVLLCISEAVINSIEHGNKNTKSKKVSVVVDCHQNNMVVKVTDEGEGFDFNHIPDPTAEENIRNEKGRGIFIIRSVSNELIFRDKGKCVEFKIELH